MQNEPRKKPTCPFKMGNLCDERCALYLTQEDEDGKEVDGICSIALLSLKVQDVAEAMMYENA